MYKNYLLIAFRDSWSHKGCIIVNVLRLATGLFRFERLASEQTDQGALDHMILILSTLPALLVAVVTVILRVYLASATNLVRSLLYEKSTRLNKTLLNE